MKYLEKIDRLYNEFIENRGEEARFLILLSFLFAFILARLIVYGIRFHWLPFLPFGNIVIREVHIHHLVFGIVFLLVAGLLRVPDYQNRLVRFSSILYGVGAALTLDEFALWLRLDPDVYFGAQGRVSIDVAVVFSLVLFSSFWHGLFWRKLFEYTISAIFFQKN